jgi:hypothetical protein
MRFARRSLQLSALVCIHLFAAAHVSNANGRSALVYYANETVEGALSSTNYIALLNILRKDPVVGPKIEATLRYDAEHSSSIVSRDIEALERIAQAVEIDFFAFSNAMALRGEYLFADARADILEHQPFSLGILPPDPALESSPLSRSVVLTRALEAVLTRRDQPTKLLLIANTHGTADFAAIPRVAANFVTADPNSILSQLSDEPHDMSLPLALSGTRKLAFWEVISDVSRRFSVEFPLIFIESCESAPHSWAEFFTIPSTVSVIAHSGFDEIKPAEIDYREFLSDDIGDLSDLSQIFTVGLAKRGVRVEPRWLTWTWPARVTLLQINVLWFFVPLTIWTLTLALLLVSKLRVGNLP